MEANRAIIMVINLLNTFKNVVYGDLQLSTEDQITLERCIECFTVIHTDTPIKQKLTEQTLTIRLNLMIEFSKVLNKIPIGRITQVKFLKSDDQGNMYDEIVRLKRTNEGFEVQYNNF